MNLTLDNQSYTHLSEGGYAVAGGLWVDVISLFKTLPNQVSNNVAKQTATSIQTGITVDHPLPSQTENNPEPTEKNA